jgi:tetratricopeptide (TPR) repeat protein
MEPVQRTLDEAKKAYQNGEYAEAARLFAQAAEWFKAAGQVIDAAEAANSQSVALLQAGDAEAALQAGQGTDKVFADGNDPGKQALALGNQGAALEALGRNDEALAAYKECARLLKETGDAENRAVVLKSISALQVRTGHHLEALASMDAALETAPRLSFRERMLKKLVGVPFQIMRR